MIRVALPIDPLHPAFAGHFPSRPIVPGVVLLDEGLRAIVRHRATEHHPAGTGCSIGAAKFLSMVEPGEPVRLEVDDASSPTSGYQLRIFAGAPGEERIAVSGSVSFDRATD